MNALITSKNFKATFTIDDDCIAQDVKIVATSSEARKFLKHHGQKEPSYTDTKSVGVCLKENETQLRAWVLAKIGG